MTHSLTHSLIHSLTHSLTHSVTHSLIHSLTHSQLSGHGDGYSVRLVPLDHDITFIFTQNHAFTEFIGTHIVTSHLSHIT